MWKLISEDTFGFGEDRDPPLIEKTGDRDIDGFMFLWEAVLNESITGTPDNPARGFIQFSLILFDEDSSMETINIDTHKYLQELAHLKKNIDSKKLQKVSDAHYKAFIMGEEEKFLNNLSNFK